MCDSEHICVQHNFFIFFMHVLCSFFLKVLRAFVEIDCTRVWVRTLLLKHCSFRKHYKRTHSWTEPLVLVMNWYVHVYFCSLTINISYFLAFLKLGSNSDIKAIIKFYFAILPQQQSLKGLIGMSWLQLEAVNVSQPN